jgi:hypothetical protein
MDDESDELNLARRATDSLTVLCPRTSTRTVSQIQIQLVQCHQSTRSVKNTP